MPNSTISTWFLVADFILGGYTLLLVCLGAWALLGRIPRQYQLRYTKEVTWRSQLPFTEKWRESIAAEDLPVFIEARKRHHVFGLASLIFFVVILGYLLLHSVGAMMLVRAHYGDQRRSQHLDPDRGRDGGEETGLA